MLTKRTSKKSQVSTAQQPKCYSWVEHEFFYSNYDLPYYDYNEFQEILQYVGLEPIQKFSDYEVLKRTLGRPKLF